MTNDRQKMNEVRKLIGIMYLLMLMATAVGCQVAVGDKPKTALESFPFPKVPKTLTEPKERATFLAIHYWDRFDFRDTTLISRPEITEQGFADFINTLSYVESDLANIAITKMLSKAHEADSMMFRHFDGLCYNYLYAPSSPLVNEEFYIVVLRYIISSEKIDPTNKIAPYYLLEMMMKNRVGSIASDFEYSLRNGKRDSLHRIESDYTILFFNNMDCGECTTAKQYAEASSIVSNLITANKLEILSIYPNAEVIKWMDVEYPNDWINGYDSQQYIQNNKLYDLRTYPTIYLLDKDKRVVMKNRSMERVNAWLIENS